MNSGRVNLNQVPSSEDGFDFKMIIWTYICKTNEKPMTPFLLSNDIWHWLCNIWLTVKGANKLDIKLGMNVKFYNQSMDV